MSAASPAPATAPDRPASIAEVEISGAYWVYARHHMREVRIVAKARTRVHVAFWIYYRTPSQTLVVQAVPYYALRRQKPAPAREAGFVLSWPAPSAEDVAAAVARIE